jgi:hypothetical protein
MAIAQIRVSDRRTVISAAPTEYEQRAISGVWSGGGPEPWSGADDDVA